MLKPQVPPAARQFPYNQPQLKLQLHMLSVHHTGSLYSQMTMNPSLFLANTQRKGLMYCACTVACLYSGGPVQWCACTVACLYSGIPVQWRACTVACLYSGGPVQWHTCTVAYLYIQKLKCKWVVGGYLVNQ